ncbi:MAG: hypothetical protein C4320_00430 [Armatimonadota bacterium]
MGNAGEIASRNVRGVPVAFVAFAFNRVSDNVNDIPAARRLIARAAATGARVVVSVHWGAEGTAASRTPKGPEIFFGESRGDSRRFAHAVVESGADLVLGSGPHVPRAMEVYRGRLIAYSLGNFATYGLFSLRGASALAPILVTKMDPVTGRFVGGRIVSARQTGRGGPHVDPTGAATREIARLSRLDFPITGVRMDPRGRFTSSGPRDNRARVPDNVAPAPPSHGVRCWW